MELARSLVLYCDRLRQMIVCKLLHRNSRAFFHPWENCGLRGIFDLHEGVIYRTAFLVEDAAEIVCQPLFFREAVQHACGVSNALEKLFLLEPDRFPFACCLILPLNSKPWKSTFQQYVQEVATKGTYPCGSEDSNLRMAQAPERLPMI